MDTHQPPALYPRQLEGVDLFVHAPRPRRRIFAWGTGVGKTPGGLTAIDRLQPARVLIVCPAVVRRHWLTEVARWAPSLASDTHVIECGRERQLRGARHAARQAAYSARVQIVSYDLVGEVDRTGWDLIVLDELHHIAAPLSKQSRVVGEIIRLNPRADILGLSATLIPTEASQLWNPLRLLFGERAWGAPDKRGDVSWQFRAHYCELERSEYGTRAFGCRDDRRQELRDRLAQVTHCLTRADIRADLPALDLHALELPRDRGDAAALVHWADEVADASHIVILVHLKDTAKEICDLIRTSSVSLRNHALRYIDGAVPPSQRIDRLAECGSLDRCVLVATHDSMTEGVRLMWAQSVAIAQWSQSPGKIVQLLGRFNSVGSDARPAVHLVCSEQTYGAAQTLIYRVQVMQSVLASGGQTANDVVQLLQLPTSELSPEALAGSWAELFESANLDTHRDAWASEEVGS